MADTGAATGTEEVKHDVEYADEESKQNVSVQKLLHTLLTSAKSLRLLNTSKYLAEAGMKFLAIMQSGRKSIFKSDTTKQCAFSAKRLIFNFLLTSNPWF